MAKAQKFEHSGEDRFFALLSYLWILFLVPLLAKKDSPWVHKHAKQGFILFLASLLTWIPLIGWIWAVYLFICWIIVVVKVLIGAPYWNIPIVGNIAEKINI